MLSIAALCVLLLGYVGLFIYCQLTYNLLLAHKNLNGKRSLLFLVICSDKAILQHSIYAIREVGLKKIVLFVSSHARDTPVQYRSLLV